jgi:predicted permease
MPNLLRRFRYWINLRTRASDLAEEIEGHRAMTQEKLERSGMPAVDAADASRRSLGNVTLAREDAREVWIWPSVERLWQDVRYGARMLLRQPTFAATAMLTLAVGIGATTAVFSVVEAEIWRPLPFPEPDRLASVDFLIPSPRRSSDPVAVKDFVDWRAQNQTFDELAAFRWTSRRVLRGRDVPEFVRTTPVTSNFFSALRLSPAVGRSFGPEDDGAGNAVILSDGCWRRLFDADAAVIGRSIVLDDKPHQIVGVLGAQARLEFTTLPDLFVLIDLKPAAAADRDRRNLLVVGRLKPKMGIAAAEADLRTIFARRAGEDPTEPKGLTVRVSALREAHTGYNWRPLYFFLAAAVFVLLLSCANVANLLLARALSRQREFAIRAALGGGRAALVRQLLVEGLLLALPGTGAGLVLAVWTLRAFSAWMPADYLSRGGAIQLDARIGAFALIVGGVTAIVFGLAPAFFTRLDLNTTLAPGNRTVGGSVRQRRARHALIVAEITTAFVLVFGAGLFFNSFQRLAHQPLGFDPRDRFTMGVTLTGARYAQPGSLVGFADRLRREVAAVPGVVSTAIATSAPLGSGPSAPFVVSGRPRPTAGAEDRLLLRAVTPEYFRTFAIRHLAGRELTEQDVEGGPRVALVNESLARRIFPGEDPVGREIVILAGARMPWVKSGPVQIVGVVSNIKDVGMNENEFNGIYLPFAQNPSASIQLAVSASVPPSTLTDAVRRAVLAVDPDLPVVGVRTMSQQVEGALRPDRFNLLLIGAFAIAAIVLASIGIYGAMSYATAQRTAEFGLRRALGAQRAGILVLALGASMRLGVAGTVLGLAVTLALARVVGNALYLEDGHLGLLYGIRTTDPATLAFACVALVAVAALAGAIPAWRASRVDPMVALRSE